MSKKNEESERMGEDGEHAVWDIDPNGFSAVGLPVACERCSADPVFARTHCDKPPKFTLDVPDMAAIGEGCREILQAEPGWAAIFPGDLDEDAPPVVGPAFIDGWKAEIKGVYSTRHGDTGRVLAAYIKPDTAPDYVLVTTAPTGEPIKISGAVLRHLLGGGQ